MFHFLNAFPIFSHFYAFVSQTHNIKIFSQQLIFYLSFPLSLTSIYNLVRPLDVRITTLRRPLLVGKRVEISCQSTGARPPAVITWWKGHERLPAHSVSAIPAGGSVSSSPGQAQSQTLTKPGLVATHVSWENMTTSSVTFVASIEDDKKLLSCRADHSILPDSAIEDQWLLNVYCKCHTLAFCDSLDIFYSHTHTCRETRSALYYVTMRELFTYSLYSMSACDV